MARKPAAIKVVNVKTSRGMEDDCFSFDVKRGRELIAKVTYLGTGGPTDVDCASPEHKAALIEELWPEMQPYLIEVERESLQEWERIERHDLAQKAEQKICALKDAKTGAEGAALCSDYVTYLEFWAGKVMNDREIAKELKRLKHQCTLRIWGVREDTKPGYWAEWKSQPTEENISRLIEIQKRKGHVLKVLRPEHFDKWGLEAARQLRRQCEWEHMQSRHAAPLEAE